MNRLTSVAIVAAAAALVLDTVGAIASSRLGFSYSYLSPVSMFIYGAAGFAASRIAGLRAAAIVGSAVALIEATLGWFISWQIGPGRPPPEYSGAAAVLFAVVLVTAMGAFIGLVGGAAARRFAFMAFTRRHQALHDVLAPTTARIPSLDRVVVGDGARGRAEETSTLGDMPSKGRRILVTGAYSALSFVAMSISALATVSESCIKQDVCTPGDNRQLEIAGLTWFAVVALCVVLGWRGRLWGARRNARGVDETYER